MLCNSRNPRTCLLYTSIATRHGNFAVKKGDKLAGTRIIPLVIEEEKMTKAKEAAMAATGNKPILNLLPFKHKKVGIVTTGNEVFYGRIKDTFTPVIEGKLAEFDTEIIDHVTWNDDDTKVTASILDMIHKGADIVVCTGGMSVDPDDKTPLAIKNTGADLSLIHISSVILSASNDADIKIMSIYSRSPKAFKLFAKDDSIKTAKDLKGKKVAGPKGTILHELLVAYLNNEGMTEDDIEFMAMGIPDAQAALAGGSVDAALLAGPTAYNMEKDGYYVVTDGEGLTEADVYKRQDIESDIPSVKELQEQTYEETKENVETMIQYVDKALTDVQMTVYVAVSYTHLDVYKRQLEGGYIAWLREEMRRQEAEDIKNQVEQSIRKKFRKTIWSPFTKAVKQYELVKEGDKVAVCISGGKDSMLMAKLFQELKLHNKFPFEVEFLVMDPGYSPDNRHVIEENARKLGIPVHIFESDIFDAVFTIEKSPCYLCARMRRGYLYSYARELGCNKIALGQDVYKRQPPHSRNLQIPIPAVRAL